MLKERTGGRFFNLGYEKEVDYWNSLCVGVLAPTGATTIDAMVSYLSSQGYTGTPTDQFNAWLQAMETQGFIDDNARALTGT